MLILMTCIVIVGILGGGYYVSVSAVTGIVLTGVLFYRMYVKKRITAAWDLNMAAFAVLVFGYLLSCLWAVDSGMALMGVVKFLPLLLFYVLVSGLTDEREKMIASLPMLGCLMTAFSFVMMAKYLREATETYVVGIAGPYHTELKKWCHEIVEIPNRDALLSLDVITSFSGATYILDIFFALLLSKRYEEHARSSMEMLNHLSLLWDETYHTKEKNE